LAHGGFGVEGGKMKGGNQSTERVILPRGSWSIRYFIKPARIHPNFMPIPFRVPITAEKKQTALWWRASFYNA